MQSEPAATRARRLFWALFIVVLGVKIAVAMRLPLFVDEAFYWQEGQHLAAAYSDLNPNRHVREMLTAVEALED